MWEVQKRVISYDINNKENKTRKERLPIILQAWQRIYLVKEIFSGARNPNAEKEFSQA